MKSLLDDLFASLDPEAGVRTDLQPMVPPISEQPRIPEPAMPKRRIPPSTPEPQAQSIAAPQAPADIDPVVKSYITDKYSLDNRQKMVDENSKYDLGGRATAALAALGAGFQGRDSGAAGSAVLNRLTGEKQAKLAEFDKMRGQEMENQRLGREDSLFQSENDPNSQESALAQQLAKKFAPTMDFAGKSAAQLKKMIGPLGDLFKAEQAKIARNEERAFKREAAGTKQLKDTSLEGKIAGLPASEKARFDSAKMGRKAVDDMRSALKGGDNTFTLFGDNNFTQARTRFEEALGRMQSGGAISSDEEERFRKMAPTFTDSAEMQEKKLADLLGEMDSRLGTLGFKPEEVGFKSEAESPQASGWDDKKAARLKELRAKAMGSGLK